MPLEDPIEDSTLSPAKLESNRNLRLNLFQDQLPGKILALRERPPKAIEGFQADATVLYTQSRPASGADSASKLAAKVSRAVPQAPDRILDAPAMRSDFYLNNLSWSPQNVLSVALDDTVYLWNASTGSIKELCRFEGGDYVTSLAWLGDGAYLAVGSFHAQVQIWDAAAQRKLRTMTGHTARVAALDWNNTVLTSGCKSGQIFNHDVRVASHIVARMSGHTQEVCGLKWSPNGQLASGGNDNLVNIWTADGSLSHSFTDHQAAVKALAWCPWQPNLLASGGGTADRHLRFWNTSSGACVRSVDTKSQISTVLWSDEHRELISGHGYSSNQLIIWKYPTLTKVAELQGHSQRIISMAMSPDGSTVVSAGGDETLRFWKCFTVDPKKKKKQSSLPASKLSALIR
jgi:cell division cycle 20, cofactor of APC complex